MRREFLQLAKIYDPKKHGIAGWFVSEKLDGQRAFWDGGITRGVPVSEVPWAGGGTTATGLWSRYGRVILAPNWWLDCLPPVPLDGELYCGNFQDLMSITRRTVNVLDTEWLDVKYYVFDSPSWENILLKGEIKNRFHEVVIKGELIYPELHDISGSFKQIQKVLQSELVGNRVVVVHKQEQLPWGTNRAVAVMRSTLDRVVEAGGEGLILRHPHVLWYPKRVDGLLKVKPVLDGEATVIGYKPGKGKHEGRLGSLIVEAGGKCFHLSGFTDYQREHAEELFPIGSEVNYEYRELSNDGIPKEARFVGARVSQGHG